jgi:hypothetical protein
VFVQQTYKKVKIENWDHVIGFGEGYFEQRLEMGLWRELDDDRCCEWALLGLFSRRFG